MDSSVSTVDTVLDEDSSFASFGLDDRILKAIAKMGFGKPTLVQSSSIPLALQGKDVLARARTGSGKTAAYSIPLLQTVLSLKENEEESAAPGIKALVLVPTRELCDQVRTHLEQLCLYCPRLSVLSIANDATPQQQRVRLAELPDIVVATPSRLVAHLNTQSVSLAQLKMLVLDEADLILSYGYAQDVHALLAKLGGQRCQTLLMSATLSPAVQGLKQLVLHNPAVLKLEESKHVASALEEYSIRCTEADKFLISYALIRLKIIPGKAIFFVNTIDGCYKLKLFLERFSIRAAVLNSQLPVQSRLHIVHAFNRHLFDYLIASDESLLAEDDDDEEQVQLQGQGEDDESSGVHDEESGDEEGEEDEQDDDPKGGAEISDDAADADSVDDDDDSSSAEDDEDEEDSAEEERDEDDEEEQEQEEEDEGCDEDQQEEEADEEEEDDSEVTAGKRKRSATVASSSGSTGSSKRRAAGREAAKASAAKALAIAAENRKKKQKTTVTMHGTAGLADDDDEAEPASGGSNRTASRKQKQQAPLAPSKQQQKQQQQQQQQQQATGGRRAVGKGARRGGGGGGAEYGVSRGIDFKGVSTVVNFDVPTSYRAYVHRVGRTARGGEKGTALTLVTDADAPLVDAIDAKRLEQRQQQPGAGGSGGLRPYTFHLKLIDGFRYRVEDMLRSVTRAAIKEARLKELKTEIINSDKLKTHFEENPRELQLLKHDKTLQQNKIKPHLKFIPNYLVPAALQQQQQQTSQRGASFGGGSRGSRGAFSKRGGRGKNDPLRSFKASSGRRQLHDEDHLLHRKRDPAARGRGRRRKPYDPSHPAMK